MVDEPESLCFSTEDMLSNKGDYSKSEPIYGLKRISYNIYKEPVTDDGTKKSLRGLIGVFEDANGYGVLFAKEQCTWEEESQGLLQVIYEDGKFFNQTTLTEVRQKLEKL